jgi:hypothetical protein
VHDHGRPIGILVGGDGGRGQRHERIRPADVERLVRVPVRVPVLVADHVGQATGEAI